MDEKKDKSILEPIFYGFQNNDDYQNQNTPDLHVARPVYQIEDLHKDTLYEKPYSTVKSKVANYCKSIHPLECLLSTVPLLQWLPEYSWKKHFFSDFISGLTVAIMHIPQGLAYGLLGNVPPITGIYMAFFPVLVYFVFGTSKHVSMGTFAIVCLMTGKVVSEHTNIEIMQNGTSRSLSTISTLPDVQLTNVQVAATVTFTVAMLQLVMFALRLGAVSNLLSDNLVSGFTCASAFHVVSSQLKDLLGLSIGKRRGNFSFVYTLYDVMMGIPTANVSACTISLIACVILVANNEAFKPWLSKKCKMPFPIELVAVVLGTGVMYFTGIHETHHVSTVGYIPTGLPEPIMPVFSLIPHIWLDAVVIMMVSYTITMSMALIFARKLMYEVDSNQELLAMGLSNCLGSVFSCLPLTASLSRSMIQQTVGGVTQLASVVSSSLLLIVLLWVGPAFQTLPRCVLASIIVIALKGMLLQIKDLPRHWRLSRWDGFVWAVTFFVTLFVQISVGLAAGVAASILSVAAQGLRLQASILGRLAGTDLYLDMKRHKAAVEVPSLKIIHFVGGLSFAAREAFKDLFVQKIGFDPAALLRKRVKLREKGVYVDEDEDLMAKGIILDFTSLTFLDPSGVVFLRQLQSDLEKLGIALYISGCSGRAYEVITNCDRREKKDSKFLIFPTVHDAVLFAQATRTSIKSS
ncbi:prestin-like isoform X2 [Anthonomus grandis grandis]|uniref:prestin-like isoform X2 n=1 Tax=Anthonomus grandis grandis TaxID=2921223 RepID=UPI00216573CF|nr:prestin-like isoform X2 [Anthonomus grandis grandis]XP_050313188.1 prestin-like isoform X2 [Anthonomus grandis grandis]